MWHYLFFIVLVKVKDSTEYTGPESYVAEMIKVNAKHFLLRRHLACRLQDTESLKRLFNFAGSVFFFFY